MLTDPVDVNVKIGGGVVVVVVGLTGPHSGAQKSETQIRVAQQPSHSLSTAELSQDCYRTVTGLSHHFNSK